MDWDFEAKRCGNCRWWELSDYGAVTWNSGEWSEPAGNGGYHSDGWVADCRRHAPCGVKQGDSKYNAAWPQTQKHDCCGDFERRHRAVPTPKEVEVS